MFRLLIEAASFHLRIWCQNPVPWMFLIHWSVTVGRKCTWPSRNPWHLSISPRILFRYRWKKKRYGDCLTHIPSNWWRRFLSQKQWRKMGDGGQLVLGENVHFIGHFVVHVSLCVSVESLVHVQPADERRKCHSGRQQPRTSVWRWRRRIWCHGRCWYSCDWTVFFQSPILPAGLKEKLTNLTGAYPHPAQWPIKLCQLLTAWRYASVGHFLLTCVCPSFHLFVHHKPALYQNG